MDKWLRGPLKENLLAFCNRDYLKKQEIFDADFVSSLVEKYMITGDGGPATGANYSKILWSLFAFQQWYHYYCE